MAFCSGCGASIADAATFCPQCGKRQGASTSGAPPAAQSGLAENVAGALCYVLGWITGIVFLVIDKRPYVRFHAAQAIVVFAALHIVHRVIAGLFGYGWLFGGIGFWTALSFGGMLLSAVSLVTFVLWILLMIKAFQGEKFRVPLAADFAEQITGK